MSLGVTATVAAIYLSQASANIRRACAELNPSFETVSLNHLADRLSAIAERVAEGEISEGLELPLIDARLGAAAMGKTKSPKKLAALARARAILATKRARANDRIRSRKSRTEVAAHSG